MATSPSKRHNELEEEPAHHCLDASEVADKAVKKVFAILGINIDNPEAVEEFRMDLRFGKSMRKAMGHGVFALVGVIAVGFATVIWLGIKAQVGIK